MNVQIFTLLQSADFYMDLHQKAADLIGEGGNKEWLDLGCGPGLLSIIARKSGFKVRGVDRSAPMIVAAKELAEMQKLQIEFEVSSLNTEASNGVEYDVVSASSLLCVLDNPTKAIKQLTQLLKPKGQLLIIEASPFLSRMKALQLWLGGKLGRNGYMLILWAMARSGRALDPQIFYSEEYETKELSLLEGMVTVYIMERHP